MGQCCSFSFQGTQCCVWFSTQTVRQMLCVWDETCTTLPYITEGTREDSISVDVDAYVDMANFVFHGNVLVLVKLKSRLRFSSVLFSPLTMWVIRGTCGIIRQRSSSSFFLWEVVTSSSVMGRDVHYLTLSFQCFHCWPWHRFPSKVPCRVVLERSSTSC